MSPSPQRGAAATGFGPSPAPVERPRGHDGGESASFTHLLRELADESRTLVRQEVALAKTEMSEKVSHLARNVGVLAAGGVVLVVAAFLFFTAVTAGVVSLLELAVSPDVAVWLGPLLVGVALALVGFALVRKGRRALAEASLVPRTTVQTLKEDKEWISRRRAG